MKRTLIATLATTLLLGACQADTRLETRTFALQNLPPNEAEGLIQPYIYSDREGAPGTMSLAPSAVTVRETADNLDQIARVLAEYDTPRPDIRLHFQVIEADGYTGRDERIAAVEDQLRSIFQFQGYRLAGEAYVAATDASEIAQSLNQGLRVEGRVFSTGPGSFRVEVYLYSHEHGNLLTTTVNIRTGQTLVLGSAARVGNEPTLLLTVRADEVTQ